LDFLYFVLRYEELHPDKELTFDGALHLYSTYDIEWRYEVNEARQYKRYVTDNGVQIIKGMTGNEQNGT
jgi:hypothetical protein